VTYNFQRRQFPEQAGPLSFCFLTYPLRFTLRTPRERWSLIRSSDSNKDPPSNFIFRLAKLTLHHTSGEDLKKKVWLPDLGCLRMFCTVFVPSSALWHPFAVLSQFSLLRKEASYCLPPYWGRTLLCTFVVLRDNFPYPPSSSSPPFLCWRVLLRSRPPWSNTQGSPLLSIGRSPHPVSPPLPIPFFLHPPLNLSAPTLFWCNLSQGATFITPLVGAFAVLRFLFLWPLSEACRHSLDDLLQFVLFLLLPLTRGLHWVFLSASSLAPLAEVDCFPDFFHACSFLVRSETWRRAFLFFSPPRSPNSAHL